MHYAFKRTGHSTLILYEGPNWDRLFQFIDGTYDYPRYGWRDRACAPVKREDVDRVYAAHEPVNEQDVCAVIGRAGSGRYFAAWGGDDHGQGRCESTLEAVLRALPEYEQKLFGVNITTGSCPAAGWTPGCHWSAPNATWSRITVDGVEATHTQEEGFWPSCASTPDEKGRIEVRTLRPRKKPKTRKRRK